MNGCTCCADEKDKIGPIITMRIVVIDEDVIDDTTDGSVVIYDGGDVYGY